MSMRDMTIKWKNRLPHLWLHFSVGFLFHRFIIPNWLANLSTAKPWLLSFPGQTCRKTFVLCFHSPVALISGVLFIVSVVVTHSCCAWSASTIPLFQVSFCSMRLLLVGLQVLPGKQVGMSDVLQCALVFLLMPCSVEGQLFSKTEVVLLWLPLL